MLIRDVHSQSIPYLHLHDKVYQALQMMTDAHIGHLPVTEGDKYLGIISEDDLLQAPNENMQISAVMEIFPQPSIQQNEHFLKAMQVAVENGITMVPIIDENGDMFGAVTYADLLRQASEFMSVNDPGGLIVLEMDSQKYSFNEISRLVETNDSQITQLNTYTDTHTGMMQVTIKINKMEVSDIVATFQRYDYNVKHYFGEELYENELKSNYDNLMNYLKI
jgi:signal-transduction protein with cAMP-binding, CBS, and nucleotidyltransferase domain